MKRLEDLVSWLGPDGAQAGLERSDLTVAELLELEPNLATGKSVAKLKRAELIKEIIGSVRSRLTKSPDELMEMDAEALKNYFVGIKASREELLSLLLQMDIRPGSAARKNLTEFAAREISDIGMYRRVAMGRGEDVEPGKQRPLD